MAGVKETVLQGVERLLQSESFRHAPSSRRLLRYLADHSTAPDADQLKEYTIGIDAFGKSANYDPRLDSTVRIQIGRLRQKLAEYYLSEGKDDAVIIELPRGRFKLQCVVRSAPEAIAVESPVAADTPGRWRTVALVLGSLLLVVLIGGAWVISTMREKLPVAAAVEWSAELEELWQPFLANRPVLLAVGSPLFLQFDNKAIYRDLSIEKWEEMLASPNYKAVNQALVSRESRPVHYYSAVGDLSAAFLIGQRLGMRQPNISVMRSSQLLWQQMADANILFLGPPRFFGERLGHLPVTLEITEGPDGFHNLHPQEGEAALFKYREPDGFFAEDGEACVLVTRSAGPDGNTEIETFASNSTFGRLGAVKAFTDPQFGRMLVTKMRNGGGHIPKYFQVLLKVKYKGGVPTETTYLLHRELHRN